MNEFSNGGTQYRQAGGLDGTIEKQDANGQWSTVPATDPVYAMRAAQRPVTPGAAAPAAPAAAPAGPALDQGVIDAFIARYPALKGWTANLDGVGHVLTPPNPGHPAAYPGDPTYVAATPGGIDTGARTIEVINPNGRAGATNSVSITVARGDGGNWTVTKGPDDTKEPTPASTTHVATPEEQAVLDRTAAAGATTAESDAATTVAKNTADDAQRSYNYVQHGLWLTHDEYAKYQESKDTNERANIKAQADAKQQVWANANVEKQNTLQAQQQDLAAHPPQKQKDANGNDVEWLYDPVTKKYAPPAGVTGAPPQARWLIGDNNDSARLVTLDGQGHVMSDDPNPAYQAKATTVTSDTVAPNIHIMQQQPDGTMKLVSVPNDNQLTVSQAMMSVLYPQLAAAMTDGKMDAQTAKDMMTAASNQVKDQISAGTGATTAANDTLTQLNQGASTGASLLNQRVKSTQDSLSSWQSAASGNKNIGLGTQLGPNFGANLVQGLGDWATQMGGGQGVYDNAAAAVSAINPDDPHSAPSYATLAQMQQRFKDLAGVPHPTEVASTRTGLTGNQPQAPQPGAVPQPASVAAPGTGGGVFPAGYGGGGAGTPFTGNNPNVFGSGSGSPTGPSDQEVEQFANEHRNEPGMNWDTARAFLTPQPAGAR